ncbi:MAG: DUF6036 family nucleotidyltransferase [Nitrospirales bacterium]|nr:hypothetical protein [Nitrospira sp.]MDR4501622.1 DUF6036 family nucleotidyltransferase [Nitrospirales bacterium]
MQPLTLSHILPYFVEYHRQTGHSVDLLLVGGLALQAYGYSDRATVDIDGELIGEFESLLDFLHKKQIPADLSENFSGWSIVAMPPGYRDRSSVWHEDAGIRLRLLHPVDFIVSKLRRGTDQDLQDAHYVVRRFGIDKFSIVAAVERAITASPKDTAIYLFKKSVENFLNQLDPE